MAIYDLSKLSSIPKDKTLFLDTNVILLIYGGYSLSPLDRRKASVFSSFLGKAKKNGCLLATTVANVQEVFHIIEKTEYEIANTTDPSKYRNLKVFRKDSKQRVSVKNKVNSLYSIIKMNLRIDDTVLLNTILEQFALSYDSHSYDPIDYFVVENQLAKSSFFVTDDKDYQADSRIDLFTVF